MGTKEIKEADVKSYARKMFKDKGYYYFPVSRRLVRGGGVQERAPLGQQGNTAETDSGAGDE